MPHIDTATTDATLPAVRFLDFDGPGVPGISHEAEDAGWRMEGSPYTLHLDCDRILEGEWIDGRFLCGGERWSASFWHEEKRLYQHVWTCARCGFEEKR